MKNAEAILENETEVLGFLKTRYPVHHLSNLFFRDVQYGIQALLERRGMKIGYSDAEALARDFTLRLEKKKMLVPIDGQSWVLYNEAYKTVAPPKPAPAKPAAEKPAPRPAAGLPPLQSATPAGAAKPGLPPLKSAAPAGAKPGLPPLKSSAPTGGTEAAGSAKGGAPAPPAATPATEKKPETKTAAQPKPVSPPPKGGLPPITSSVPAGKK